MRARRGPSTRWRALACALVLAAGAPLGRAQDAAPPAPAPSPAPAETEAERAPEPATQVVEHRFSVQMPTGRLLIGQETELIVRGPFQPSSRLDAGKLPDGVELGEPRHEQARDGEVWHVPLRLTRDGELSLEHLAIVSGDVRDELPAVTLDVALDTEGGRVPRVADALPLLDAYRTPAWVPWAAAGALLVVALVALWLWQRTHRASAAPLPVAPRSADLVAAEALARLRARLPRTQDEVPPFLQEVSDVLRLYIEDCFGVRAPESTTEEFLSVVASGHAALQPHRDALAAFLTRCDLVKFARLRPDPASAVPLLETAEHFVEATRSLAPPPQAAAAPDAREPALPSTLTPAPANGA